MLSRTRLVKEAKGCTMEVLAKRLSRLVICAYQHLTLVILVELRIVLQDYWLGKPHLELTQLEGVVVTQVKLTLKTYSRTKGFSLTEVQLITVVLLALDQRHPCLIKSHLLQARLTY
jgi:hypothetical protein